MLYKGFYHPPSYAPLFSRESAWGQGVKMGHAPPHDKKEKLQDSALPVSWEVYYLELWRKEATATMRAVQGACKNP